MASTNKTTNYELSQYVGSDKPSYLNDYNQDMNRIDLGIHAAKSEADTNATAIGTLSSLTTTAKTDLVSAINEVDSEASTANATATQADGKANTNATAIGTIANLDTTTKSDLVSAINEVNYNLGLFNLTNFSTLTITPSKGTTSSTLGLAKNSNGSLFKVYGEIDIYGLSISNYEEITVTTSDTGLRPDKAYTINALGIKILGSGSIITNMAFNQSVTVNTNGTLTMTCAITSEYTTMRIILFPCLLFNSNFGDTPTPE